MNVNVDSQIRFRLRWQLFGAWTVLLVGVTVMVFLTMKAKMGSLILSIDVERLRPAARDLTEVCADHFMSPSDRQVTIKLARIMNDFPDLSYLVFADRYGIVHSRGTNKTIDSVRARLDELDRAEKDVNVIKTGKETYVDIRDVTQTRPRLRVHVGFAQSLADAKTRSFLWNRAVMALVVLAGGLFGGLLFLTWVTRPVIELSTKAEKLSLGDMDVSFDLKSRGEIGKVYQSLERLRESVLYAIRRLNNVDRTVKEQTEQKPPEEEKVAAKGDTRWPKLR